MKTYVHIKTYTEVAIGALFIYYKAKTGNSPDVLQLVNG